MTWYDYNGNYTQKSQRKNRLFWGSSKGSYILTATEAHCHAKQWLGGIWPCERQQPIRTENKQKTKHHQSMKSCHVNTLPTHRQNHNTEIQPWLAAETTHFPWAFRTNPSLGTQFQSMPLLSLNKHQCQSAYQFLLKFYWMIVFTKMYISLSRNCFSLFLIFCVLFSIRTFTLTHGSGCIAHPWK